jgi:hypothetical protein
VSESRKSHGVIERRASIYRASCLEVKSLTVKLLGTNATPIALHPKRQIHFPAGNPAKREETTIRIRTHRFRSGITNFRNFLSVIFKPVRSAVMTIRHQSRQPLAQDIHPSRSGPPFFLHSEGGRFGGPVIE